MAVAKKHTTEILAVIPARSGSKGLPHKNIRILDGKPMLAYSIEHAKESKLINRVIVSTDNEQYAEIARSYGAETPFIRPAEFAADNSLDIDVFYHALTWLRDNENYVPDICVQLRPCSSVRSPELIDTIIQHFIDNSGLDSLRCVSVSKETPYKTWFLTNSGKLTPVMRDIHECYNKARQQLPKTYFQNGYIDAFRPRVVLEQRSMTGTNIGGYIVDEYFDVDFEEDFNLSESCVKIRNKKLSFLFEAEGVIIDENGGLIESGIELLYSLCGAGHCVYVWCEKDTGAETIEKLRAAGSVVTDGFIKTDYFVSKNVISVSDIKRILSKQGG